jgi:phage terminase small subunit
MPRQSSSSGQARRKLNSQQQEFLRLQLEASETPTNAYRLAYNDNSAGKVVSTKAARLNHHPLIAQALADASERAKTAVASAIERYSITQERVADELARLAFTRMPQVADVRYEVDQHGKRRQVVAVHCFADADPEALAAIVEVKRTAGGEISIKLADKRAALMDLARFKGWIADKPVDQRQLVMLKIER